MNDWTDEQLLLICALHDSGMPYGKIARRMSDETGRPVTRSAISGLLRRMGISRASGAD